MDISVAFETLRPGEAKERHTRKEAQELSLGTSNIPRL